MIKVLNCWVKKVVFEQVSLRHLQKSAFKRLGSVITENKILLSVFTASKFSVLKLTEIVILRVYYTIRSGFSLIWHHFSTLNCFLANNH